MDPGDIAIVFPSVGAPIMVFAMVFLHTARMAALSGDLPRAERLATRAIQLSWLLLGVGALALSMSLGSRVPLWGYLELAAALSIPVPIWYWAHAMRSSIRARREAEAAAARDGPR